MVQHYESVTQGKKSWLPRATGPKIRNKNAKPTVEQNKNYDGFSPDTLKLD